MPGNLTNNVNTNTIDALMSSGLRHKFQRNVIDISGYSHFQVYCDKLQPQTGNIDPFAAKYN
jgi:hypothetical protein